MAAEVEKFTALFKNPTVEAMYALTPREFERFVAYVLRRAGYDVKEVGPHFLYGVDLEMRLPGKKRIFGGVECKEVCVRQSGEGRCGRACQGRRIRQQSGRAAIRHHHER